MNRSLLTTIILLLSTFGASASDLDQCAETVKLSGKAPALKLELMDPNCECFFDEVVKKNVHNLQQDLAGLTVFVSDPDNEFGERACDLGGLSNLTDLAMTGITYNEDELELFFKNITKKLATLCITGCDLPAFTIEGAMTNLRKLDLTEAGLRTLANLTPEALPALEELDVSRNLITQVDLPKHNKLKRLILEEAYLRNFNGMQVQPELEYIDCEGCGNLTSLKDFPSQPKLTDLCLIDCGISNVSELRTQPRLQDLNLTSNKLRALYDMQNQPSLTSLNVSYNELELLEGFPELESLKDLSIAGNNYTTFAGLRPFAALEEIDVHCVNVESLEGFPDMPNLKRIERSEDAFCLADLDQGTCPKLWDLERLSSLINSDT